MPHGNPQANRPTPVLYHHGHVVQVELFDEGFKDGNVFLWGKVIAFRCLRKPKTGIINGNATKPIAKRLDDVPLTEGVRRISVKEEKNRPGAFVDIVKTRPPPTSTKRLSKGKSDFGSQDGRGLATDRLMTEGASNNIPHFSEG